MCHQKSHHIVYSFFLCVRLAKCMCSHRDISINNIAIAIDSIDNCTINVNHTIVTFATGNLAHIYILLVCQNILLKNARLLIKMTLFHASVGAYNKSAYKSQTISRSTKTHIAW